MIVIPDIDICRASQLMVKRYGEEAAIQVGLRADERPARAGNPNSFSFPHPAACASLARKRN